MHPPILRTARWGRPHGLALVFLAVSAAAFVLAGAGRAADGPAAEPTDPAEVPSFRRDVMPVFFRAGCNAGTCHG
ncbi:MAG: hypothetical protein ACKOTB_12855, partial [Planctomycetia bacterium]